MRVRLDSDLRRNTKGTSLIGGSPIRLVRLAPAGARLLDAWAAGEPVGEGVAAEKLAGRLLDAGMIHPVVSAGSVDERPMVPLGVVVPVLDDAPGLAATLLAIRSELPDEPIVVVDDCSVEAHEIAIVAADFGAQLIVHEENSGPAAARNTGWRALAAELPVDAIVVFVDADVQPCSGSMHVLQEHFASPQVGAVAPRVQAAPGDRLLDRYEAVRSPLDLGSEPARVRAGSRVSYVPAAALVVRLSVLEQLDGFVESMRAGEDVDFVWRVDRAGSQVRYEPAAVVTHRNRESIAALIRQRKTYGSAAADLAERHPGDVAPVAASRPMFMILALAIFGSTAGRLAAAGGAIALMNQFRAQITGYSDEPALDAARMSWRSHLSLGQWFAAATTRAWVPLVLVALPFSRRLRQWALAAYVIPAATEWVSEQPSVDLARFTALRVVDDTAYCAGVVGGAVARRSIRAFMPRVLPAGWGRTSSADSVGRTA